MAKALLHCCHNNKHPRHCTSPSTLGSTFRLSTSKGSTLCNHRTLLERLWKTTPLKWWLTLVLSKGFATFVAGCLMGKDIMGTINYWMVSELVTDRIDCECTISALLRLVMVAGIGFANVIIYESTTSPSLVWINMSALAFINQLGEGVLGVAKHGMFGHHIAKVTTTLNYQLTFVQEYPTWFKYVRTTTLLVVFVFVSAYSFYTAFSEIAVCEP